MPGEYHQFIIAYDNAGNISTSEKMVQSVINPLAPVVELAPADLAKAQAIIESNGSISSIVIDYNGTGYNAVPEVLIVGDGAGAKATATIDYSTGQLTGISMTNLGANYTEADIYIFGGLEKSNINPEVTLGETLTLGVSATDTDGQVVAIQLVIDGDKENPLSSIDISDPELKPGAFQYNGSDPQFLLHYLPSALGKLELQVVAVDDEGKITYSDPITYEVTNGDPPVVEMVGPANDSAYAIGYDQDRPITLTAKAYDPDWAFNFNTTELSQINGLMFFANDRFIGQGVRHTGSNLYSVEWLPTIGGNYKIVAYAIDSQGGFVYEQSIEDLPNVDTNRGNIGISQPLYLDVVRSDDSILPEIEIISHEVNSTTSQSLIRLEALASDPDGNLDGVVFYVNGEAQASWSGTLDFNGSLPDDGDTLVIDDGTDRNQSVTFEFDDDQSVLGGLTPLVTGSSWNHLDDLVVSGNPTHHEPVTFVVEIDSTGTTDTFRWSKDGGQTFVNERVDITASTALALSHGLEITFAAQTGHGLGDRWSFTGRPANVIVTIAENGGEVQRTRDALVSAINDQHDLGLLSMRAATDGTTDSISLTHTMDRWINHQVVVSGTSLTTITLLEDSDHVIRREPSQGLATYPFGATWNPAAPGIFHIYAVAQDKISGNRVMSSPIILSSTTGTGLVPEIELAEMQRQLLYNGNALNLSLSAVATDSDGYVQQVAFYVNGELVGTDTSSPTRPVTM